MSQVDTIGRIRDLNPTVSERFLRQFSYRQLRAYLERLESSIHTSREVEYEISAVAHPSLVASSRRASA